MSRPTIAWRPPPSHTDASSDETTVPIGQRYQEQIIEDFVSDMVDEVYQEQLHNDEEWMKKRVLSAGAVTTSTSAG